MKKTNVLLIVIAAITLFLTSCGGSKFVEDDIINLLFNYDKGILAGVDIGDNWEDIKANHNPEFTVREQTIDDLTYYQLRKDNNDDNMIHVDFELDENKNVTKIKYSIMLTVDGVEDIAFMNKIRNTIADFFTNKMYYPIIIDQDNMKEWEILKNKKTCIIHLYSSENTEQKIGHIDINVRIKK